jgi:hypothetical protein
MEELEQLDRDQDGDGDGVPPNPPDLREGRREQKKERSSRSRSRRSARRPAAAEADHADDAIQNPDRDIRNFRLHRRDRDMPENLNAHGDGNANANANGILNPNPANAALDEENEGFGMLRDQDVDRGRDLARVAAAHRVDPDNHVSVSDDEAGNFNELFLQRIKKHMKASKRKNSVAQLSKKKAKGSYPCNGEYARGWDDTRQRKMVFSDAGAVLEELNKLTNKKSIFDDAKDNDNCKDHERDGKASSRNAENVNDDESDVEDVGIDAQYVEALNLLDASTVMPSRLLWGRIDDRQGSTLSRRASGNDDDDDDNDSDSDISDIPPAGELPAPRARNRKINKGSKGGGGGGGDGNNSDDNGNDDGSKGSKKVVEIPRTWLSAGFTLSDCGSGLALSKPDDTELARLKSMQSTLFPPGSSTIPPLPPFHCGGITMLTSLVTALLYSGVSIQGKEINCNSAKRKAFAHLTIDEKKKQFTIRLADALSAILFVAGETSSNFRLHQLAEISQKLEKRHESKRDGYDSEEEHEKDHHFIKDRAATERVMETRAMLCRVCRWDESGDNKDVEPLDKDPLKMQVSLTNRRDLKSFVVANLRSFMAPGGCALFLETVMHIHGLPRLHRMLCEARGIACKNMCSFINCNCEKKLKEEWDDFLRKRKIDSSIRQKDWTEPLCRDCVAPELLSILLTGKPNADMKDWVAEKFGIGVLSGAVVEEQRAVNASLISPQHPVWMIEEDNAYSVMWNEDNEETKTAALGQDSFSFKLNCWNCWDEDLERDIYRIIPGRRNPSALAGSSDPITKMDVDQTIVNPDDELVYRDFRRWRYAFGVTSGTDHSNLSKPFRWIPLYNLNDRQREIVLRKNALNIQLAVWSKWPNAHVEEAENNYKVALGTL